MWDCSLVVVEVEMLDLALRVVRGGDGGLVMGSWVIVSS